MALKLFFLNNNYGVGKNTYEKDVGFKEKYAKDCATVSEPIDL